MGSQSENVPKVIKPEEWLTVTEAAKILGTNREWVHRLCQRGYIQSIKAFGRKLIPRSEVMRWLQTRSRRAREKRDKQ